jgi:hypothetical protein
MLKLISGSKPHRGFLLSALALAACGPADAPEAEAPAAAQGVSALTDGPACASLPATLTVNGEANWTLECSLSATYTDPGAVAADGCGNALTVHSYNSGQTPTPKEPGPNPKVEGDYAVSYWAQPPGGHAVAATRWVKVDDRTAPTLTLKGAAHIVHTCNRPFVDPGAEATDACYGNLSHVIWRTGEVNGWAQGTYTITYTLTDPGGNVATPITRTVEVVNCPW